MTVEQLIEELKKFPPQAKWYGYDDQSIIIHWSDRDTNCAHRDEGYIKPSGDVRPLTEEVGK